MESKNIKTKLDSVWRYIGRYVEEKKTSSFSQDEKEQGIREAKNLVRGAGYGFLTFLLSLAKTPLNAYPLGIAFMCVSRRYT